MYFSIQKPGEKAWKRPLLTHISETDFKLTSFDLGELGMTLFKYKSLVITCSLLLRLLLIK